MCQLIYKPTKEPMNTIILMTISFGGPAPSNDIYTYYTYTMIFKNHENIQQLNSYKITKQI